MQTRPPADAAGTSTLDPEGAPFLPPRVSWGAILAGAVVAVSIGAALNVLGLAVGAGTVDAATRGTPAASTLGIGAGVWLVVSNLIGLGLGGYVAARLSGTADATDAMLHGLGVWSAAFLVSAVLLGNLVAGTASTAVGAVSGVVGGAARGTGQALSVLADQANPQALIERARLSLTGPSEPDRMTTEQRTAEITSLIGRRVANGSLDAAQRGRLNALVAAEAGVPEAEAERRIAAYEADAQRIAQETEERARRAADAAANATAKGAFWLFVALLLGALAATFGARAGQRGMQVVVPKAPAVRRSSIA